MLVSTHLFLTLDLVFTRKKWSRFLPKKGTVFYPFFKKKTAPQWNQDGSTVEPKQLQFLKSGSVFKLFLENYGKRLHFWQTAPLWSEVPFFSQT